MHGFIKRFSDFSTAKVLRAVEWDLPLRSTEDEVGTVVVPLGDVSNGEIGDWLIMDGALMRIESVSPGSSTTTIKCRDLISAFSRTLLIQELEACETVTEFIGQTIMQKFKLADDSMFKIPYLTVSESVEGDVVYQPPETDEYGRFQFADYLRAAARTHNIHLSWKISGADTLAISVGRGEVRGGQIVLGVGPDQLAEVPVFAIADVAKITALKKIKADDGSESIQSTDFYLYTDGTYGTNAAGGERAEGGWDYITAGPDATADEISEMAAQRFARGMNDSKISFWSERDLTVGAPVVLRAEGMKHSGYISYKGVKSTDRRYFYRCGNRPVTLTERLRAAEKVGQAMD